MFQHLCFVRDAVLQNLVAILVGRNTKLLLEYSREVMRIFEAKVVTNFTYRERRVAQLVCRLLNNHLANVLLRRAPQLLAHNIAEIVGREVQDIGTRRYRRQLLQHIALATQVVADKFTEF